VLVRVRLTEELPEEPPKEFRIFRAGPNATSKGTFLFDAQAAAEVIAAYKRDAVDLMIDLNHDSLDADAKSRPDAGDARGWFKLEVRSGELWAVDVKWTPDGERRLRERTQRYISPVFDADKETKRVAYVLNAALCAMPATYGAQQLVAASKQAGAKRTACYALSICLAQEVKKMNPELFQKALAAIESGDEKAQLEVLKEMMSAMAGGGEMPKPEGGEALAETPEPKPEEKEGAAMAALTKRFDEQQKQIATLLAKVQEQSAASAAVELEERRGLVSDLVKCDVEFPAHAWQKDDKGEVTTTPAKRLLDEPLEDLRARVAAHKKANPEGLRKGATPPVGDVIEIKLSKAEAEYCKKHSLTAEQFAAKKAGTVKKATK
jgi:phage I-like protein